MKILLDSLQAGNLSGTGTYADALARCLSEVGSDASVSAVFPVHMAERFGRYSLAERFPSSTAGFPLGTLARTMQMRRAIRHTRPDIIHYPATFARLTGRGGVSSAKLVVTVHDLSFMRHPEWFTKRRSVYYNAAIRPTVSAADMVLADSEATADDLRSRLGVASNRIAVTPLGVDERFGPASAVEVESARSKYKLPERFFLYVGTIEPRKNLPRAIEAFNHIADKCELDLVIAGRVGWRAEKTKLAHALSPHRSRIHFPGFVADEDLPAVLSSAHAFVWPSLWEGFGLPPLEAMACGTPVVTSSTSSLPEVVGDAALQIDPEDAGALSEAMMSLATDNALRERLREAGIARAKTFTWRRTAELTMNAYKQVLSR